MTSVQPVPPVRPVPVGAPAAPGRRKADHYDDPEHNYLHYWRGRDYEHEAERIALDRLLRGRRFATAVDVGGGYGRLCRQLAGYADSVLLAEPSQQQLDLAEDYLRDYPTVDHRRLQADDLQLPDSSVDLLTMVRVMHHLPDPTAEFAEIARVLHPQGRAVIEVANALHARNRVRHAVRRQPLPTAPVDVRTVASGDGAGIPFVNHNPRTVAGQLARAGLVVERTLSVSNLRSPGLKKVLPTRAMLAVERVLQPALARTYFGPSVFFLVRHATGLDAPTGS